MGLFVCLLKFILKILIYFAVFVSVILLIPNLPPYSKFTAIKLEPTQPRSGVLAPNAALNNADKLFTNKLIGPESFLIYNGELYTGLATGEVVKISPGGHITFVTKIGQPCTGLSQEHICGRPLGLEIDEKNNILYVADAYYGIWKVNLKNDKKQLLVLPNEAIDDRYPKIFNDIALDKSGNLYWTHSSSDYDLKDGAMTPLSDPSGRLSFYNSKTNRSNVLVDDLWFPNGVVLSPDSQFVLVSESNRYRLLKYYINGPKKGKTETFAAGLPGIPDNLKVLPDGSGVIVSLYVAFDDENPLLSRTLAATPLARKFLARLIRMIEIPFEFLNEQYPHVILEEIVYKIGHFSSLSGILPQSSGILQLNWDGEIIASYFNTDKSIGTVSDAIVYNDKLYIGSPHSSYIGSVPVPPLLKNAFSKARTGAAATNNAEVKRAQPKVESAPTTKNVKKPETEKVKVAEKIDVPKPAVQKPIAKQPNVGSQQIKKESSKTEKVEVKPNKQEAVVKPKPVETKPIKQETASVPKPVETKPIKEETKPKKVETKPIKEESKPKPVETKPNKKETEAKSKPAESKPIKQESLTKAKTVEPESSKKETKSVPVDPKSTAPKQQTVPQKGTDTVNSKSEPKPVQGKETPSKKSKESDIKQNVVQPEPVKAAKVEKPEVKPSQSKTDKIKVKTPTEPQKPVPDQIPVKEEIPSDRVQPAKETLKVIKKNGPVEIPNPN
ncbi:Adipocyte plasma membrane-associated protein [Papilio machaon]|uniref:Adipocyte plasma membrane-associated protein n=1 Tax=Papilio machaon TaxID=76193 RepID=A0A194RQD8_PAPMA|nr:Adipocyte plasma membrane-associated protein [Papilio machaon]